MARLLDEAGVDLILVGDSAGMVVHGMADTTEVTMDMMLQHVRAVGRARTGALVVADLPAKSYEWPDLAIYNAKRLMAAGAEAVKLEGGARRKRQVEAMISTGVPVMGHLGMLPQAVREEGGYCVKGKTQRERDQLLSDAAFLDQAGVFAIVLELVAGPVAAEITRMVSVPTIGIGSGSGKCDGTILVTHDLIGLFPWFRPAFVKEHIDLATSVRQAAEDYVNRVRNPSATHGKRNAAGG